MFLNTSDYSESCPVTDINAQSFSFLKVTANCLCQLCWMNQIFGEEMTRKVGESTTPICLTKTYYARKQNLEYMVVLLDTDQRLSFDNQ